MYIYKQWNFKKNNILIFSTMISPLIQHTYINLFNDDYRIFRNVNEA
jgi:hypothetical protein